ncbi:MAG: hypothetical protein FWG28_01485 [Clostridiales bacterium]|nr:hypothetical protein [Clostridiales bacterium]
MENTEKSMDMDYSLKDLLEQARKDESWEPDEKTRERLTAELERALNYL